MEKVLISACFLGANVRYNAKIKSFSHDTLTQWQAEGRLIAICPEVIGGLSTPRPAAEYNALTEQVITTTGKDVTAAFRLGAKKALLQCQQHNIRYALLKESSPSCGSQKIYDGSFSGKKIPGKGVTTQLLEQHGINVYSEDNFEQLVRVISLTDQATTT